MQNFRISPFDFAQDDLRYPRAMKKATLSPSNGSNFEFRASRQGFTAIEMIVVLGIFILSAAVTLPFLGTFQQTENLETVSIDALQALRRAQVRTMTGQRDLSWGVQFRTGGFTLYAGKNFDERVSVFDEEHRVPIAFSFTGLTLVQFSRPNGLPLQSGTLLIMHPSNISTSIDVNAAGALSFKQE